MTKSILKAGLFCIVAAALTMASAPLKAQETNQHAGKKAAQEKPAAKPGAVPFHGKLKAVDKVAKTITVGETTVQVTSETKLTKDGKPATLEEAVIGEVTGGAYRKSDDGKLRATSIRFGAKPETADGEMATAKKSKKDQ